MILLDGGMGRELARMGAPFRQPEWSALALIERPDCVRRAHDRFAAAGAQVLTTNAYALVPFHIGEDRFAQDGGRLAGLAARLAREAADAAPQPCRVAASVPPLFGSYRPDLFDPARARSLWPRIIEPQLDDCDILLVETLSSLDETRTALALCRGLGRPVWLSATLSDDAPVLRSGETVGDWLAGIAEADRDGAVEAVLFNCSQPEVMAAAVEEAAGRRDGRRVGVYANAFPKQPAVPTANQSFFELRADITPASYAAFAGHWRDLGATIIGGCCGIGPEFIAALATALRSMDGEERQPAWSS